MVVKEPEVVIKKLGVHNNERKVKTTLGTFLKALKQGLDWASYSYPRWAYEVLNNYITKEDYNTVIEVEAKSGLGLDNSSPNLFVHTYTVKGYNLPSQAEREGRLTIKKVNEEVFEIVIYA